MNSNRIFFEKLGEAANLFIPCRDSCSFCLSMIHTNGSIKNIWEDLWDSKRRSSRSSCQLLITFDQMTNGSVIEFSNLCLFCEEPGSTIKDPIRADIKLKPYDLYISTNSLGIFSDPNKNSLCKVHKVRKQTFTTLGGIPRWCLFEKQSHSEEECPSTGSITPLRFIPQGTSPCLFVPKDASVLFSRCYFTPNPCHNESLKCRSIQTRKIIEFSDNEQHYVLIEIDKQYEEDTEEHWTFEEIIEGLPFGQRTGKYELIRSLFMTTENDFDDPFTRIPFISKINHSRDIQELAQGTDSIFDMQIIPTNTDPHYSGGSSNSREIQSTVNDALTVEHENNETIEGNETENGTQIIHREDEFEQSPLQFVSSSGLPTFICGTISDLKTLNVENTVYKSNEELGSFISLQSFLESNGENMVSSGIDGTELPSLSYMDGLSYGENKGYLQFCLDIDSLDILSKAWKLMAFNGEMFEILRYYQQDMTEKKKYLDMNNNLSNEHGEDLLSRKTFFNPNDSQQNLFSTTGTVTYPIAVTVFKMKISCSISNVKIRALIPLQVVHKLKTSCFQLIKLFNNKVNRKNANIEDRSITRLIEQFCWYVITQLFFRFASLVTETVKFPTSSMVDPCCAIKTKYNNNFHDRTTGPGSGINIGKVLTNDEFQATSCLISKHFACLELFLTIPEEERVFALDENIGFLYEQRLKNLKNLHRDTIEILRERTISNNTINYFKNHVWNGEIIGDFIKCSFHDSSPSPQSIPGPVSSSRAYQRGFIFLEDIVLFSPIIFRLTVHGLKFKLESYENALIKFEKIKGSFQEAFVQDSIIDVGCTLKSPEGENWDIILPSCTALNANLILPLPRRGWRHNTLQTQGCCVYSGSGYPDFAGLSTRKIKQFEKVPYRCGIRRMKCYSTSRHSKATRGKSLLQTVGVSLIKSLSDSSSILCQWVHQRPKYLSGNRNMVIEQKEENKRLSLFRILQHDRERRLSQWKYSRTSVGIRTEFTLSFLNEKDGAISQLFTLLNISELRSSMNIADFRILKNRNDSSDDSFSYKWPWWTDLFDIKEQCHSFQCFLPVCIFLDSKYTEIEFALEERLLSMANSIYLQGKAIMSGTVNSNPPKSLDILNALYENLGLPWITHLCLLFTRALIESAKVISASPFCNPRNMGWNMPSFLMSALGLDVTWYHYRYPAILLSRVVGLHPIIENAAEKISRRTNYHQAKLFLNLYKKEHDIREIQQMWDDTTGIPHHLHFNVRSCKEKFDHWIYGVTLQAEYKDSATMPKTLKGSTRILKSNTNAASNKLDDISIRISHHFDVTSSNKFRESLRNICVYLTCLLVSDLYNTLELLTNQFGNRKLERTSLHRERQDPIVNWSRIIELSKLCKNAKPWPDSACAVSNSVKDSPDIQLEALNEINKYFVVPERFLLKHIDIRDGHGHNLLTNRDGSISFQTFLHTLLSISQTLPSYIRTGGRRGELKNSAIHSTSSWKSIYALRILYDYVELECFEERNNGNGKPHSFVKKIYEDEFPKWFETSLKQANFNYICPRLEAETNISFDSQCQIIPWGKDPFLSWIKTSTQVESITMNIPERMMNIRRAIRGSAITLQRSQHFDYQEIISKISDFKQKELELKNLFYEHKNSNSLLSKEFEKKLIVQYKSIFNEIIRNHCLSDIIQYTFNILYRNREFSDVRQELLQPSREYAVRLLERLMIMRSLVEDEGFACCKKPDGTIISLRDVSDEDLQYVRRRYKTKNDVWMSPWDTEFYPSPMITASGKKTRRIHMATVSKILFHSGLAFKPIPRNMSLERRTFAHRDAKGYRGLHVRHIFQRFADKNEESVLTSRSMWRLKPNSLVIEKIMSCLLIIDSKE